MGLSDLPTLCSPLLLREALTERLSSRRRLLDLRRDLSLSRETPLSNLRPLLSDLLDGLSRPEEAGVALSDLRLPLSRELAFSSPLEDLAGHCLEVFLLFLSFFAFLSFFVFSFFSMSGVACSLFGSSLSPTSALAGSVSAKGGGRVGAALEVA